MNDMLEFTNLILANGDLHPATLTDAPFYIIVASFHDLSKTHMLGDSESLIVLITRNHREI